MRKASQRTTWNRKGERKKKVKNQTKNFSAKRWKGIEVKVRIKARQTI